MRKDTYEKEGYVYVFDYYWGLPVYYTPEEYATLQREEDLREKQNKLNVLDGFIKASDNLDMIVSIITDSENNKDAKKKLMQVLNIS